MSETSFSINDLLRRKSQTSLVVLTLALTVASTSFLLTFADRAGTGLFLTATGTLTVGISSAFSPLLLLLAVLTLLTSGVITFFLVSMMISHRTKDIGLMKSVGCPNDMVFGYFFSQLVVVVVTACFSGALLGSFIDVASAGILSGVGYVVASVPFNYWVPIFVSLLHLVIGLAAGARPILDAARMEPIKCMFPTYYLGTGKERKFRVLKKRQLAFRVASRSLVRRYSSTIRAVACLSAVFVLVTVGVAGSLIGDATTSGWVQKGVGRNLLMVAHQDMCEQYRLLFQRFHTEIDIPEFNYTNERYAFSEDLPANLSMRYPELKKETRLILEAEVSEVQGLVYGETSQDTKTVGDSRKGTALLVGIGPGRTFGSWEHEGELLSMNMTYDVVLSDTVARTLFSVPLAQKMRVFSTYFTVRGVCLDPLNSGNVVYMPTLILQNISHALGPNILLVQIESFLDRSEFMTDLTLQVQELDAEFTVLDIEGLLGEDLSYLEHLWSTIRILPLFSVVAASLCLSGYVVVNLSEQRHEFGVLRAVCAKASLVTNVVSRQNFIVMMSSYGIGVSLGAILTLLILIPNPVVSFSTIVEIAGWIAVVPALMFAISLYPAVRFSKMPLLDLFRPG